MAKEIILTVSLIKEQDDGYSAICTDLDVASQGETIEEAMQNVKEAIELYLESAKELGIMREVQEKLGLGDIEEGVNVPAILKTEMAVKVSV